LKGLSGQSRRAEIKGTKYTYDSTTCVVVSSCYNIGRMTGMVDAAGTESFSYDTMGRTWGDQRTTNSITKKTSYLYNLDGSLNTRGKRSSVDACVRKEND
jgi:hypothetical protein